MDQETLESLPELSPYEADAKGPRPGRKTKYTRALMVEILQRVGEGEFLAPVCRSLGIDYQAVSAWAEASPAIATALARAYEGFAASKLAEIVTISDRRVEGLAELESAISRGDRLQRHDMVRLDLLRDLEETQIKRAKLQMYGREKALTIMGGSKFAPRLVLEGDPKNPVNPGVKKSLTEYTEQELLEAYNRALSGETDPEAGESP